MKYQSALLKDFQGLSMPVGLSQSQAWHLRIVSLGWLTL